jgi:CD2 antigen cytoplasmic tail-binding protein 2
MTSRYSAARPKRAGEQFARTRRQDSESSSSKKPRFDVRNPSALAPDAPEEDVVLEADVIGGGAHTKRGAVNIDGYESDSENEGFDARAEERAKVKKGDINLADELDNYGQTLGSKTGSKAHVDDGDDGDMFGDMEEGSEDEDKLQSSIGKKKTVQFLEEDEIEGQVETSKSGGHISSNFSLDPKGKLSTHAMDDRESSDDEEDAALAAEEEGVDDEVGAGGLKRNAPKVDAFNMKAEQEEGRFDAAGNFIRKAGDPDAVHDSWLEGVSKKDMKKAAEAHEKREAERRQKRLEDDAMLTSDILGTLILQLEKGESVLEALARLGRGQKKTKKVPKWKLKKQKQGDGMDLDTEKPAEDPEQVKIKESVDAITGAADQLLTRGQTDIYEQEREMLIRQYRRETGDDWVEPATQVVEELEAGIRPAKMWEYRWTDGRDGGAKQGPYDGITMMAWQDAGYFGEGIEFRRAGDEGPWTRVVEFI